MGSSDLTALLGLHSTGSAGGDTDPAGGLGAILGGLLGGLFG